MTVLGEAGRGQCWRVFRGQVAGAGGEAQLRGRAREAAEEAADVRGGGLVRQEGRVDRQPGHSVMICCQYEREICIFNKLAHLINDPTDCLKRLSSLTDSLINSPTKSKSTLRLSQHFPLR